MSNLTTQMKEYIVHCPTEEDSRVVQERMFEMGGKWVGGVEMYYTSPVDEYGVNAAIRLTPEGVIWYADKSLYECDVYTILSPQDFLSQTAHYSKKGQQQVNTQSVNNQLPGKFFVRTPTQEMFDEVNKMLVGYFQEGEVCHSSLYAQYGQQTAAGWRHSDTICSRPKWFIEEEWPEVSYDTLKRLWLEKPIKGCSVTIDTSKLLVNTIKNTAPPPFVTKDEWINNRIEYLVEYVSNADLFEDGGVDALEELAALIRQRKRGEI